MKRKIQTYLYRVTIIDKRTKTKKFLAEIKSDLDETARRKLIDKVQKESGRVISIIRTSDNRYYPDEETKKRYY